jgi:GMP synthase (glutamine-hydrolysing)
MSNNGRMAIIDLGGQYCHLIARRLRDLGVESEIFPPAAPAEVLSHYAGVILSGGPQSVYDPNAVTIDERILRLDVPVLGICYGHQLLAKLLGGEVARHDGEYGFAQLTTTTGDALFHDTPPAQQVWMSHSDAVRTLPPGLVTLATTDRCTCAAFAHSSQPLFGLQFHPEVVHTEYGAKIL